MPKFKYVGKAAGGKPVSGTIAAENEGAAASKLRTQKIQITSLKAGGFRFPNPLAEKVTVSDVSIFSRQFSTMINAGLPVLQALNIIGEQAQNKAFKRVIGAIKEDIGSGGNLSDAMAKHPKVFDELYVNMVRSGEVGGILDAILDRLSVYLEKADSLRRKIKSALMYPSAVVSVAVLVVMFLMVKVIPTFQDVFTSFGAKLPGPTLFLIGSSHFLQHFWWVIIGGAVAAGMALGQVKRTQSGAMIVDRAMLRLPVFGSLIRKAAVAKFARTLGTLLKAGVPILEALETVAKTAGNKVLEKVINDCRANIREGQPLNEPLKKSNVFPPMVVQMVSVGEETGKLDEMLMKAADFYEDEVDTAVEGISSLLEPIIIVFLGGTIGFIVVAMFMPMFDLGNVASSGG
jgi:type IV pilus assembly protein PilC